MVVEHQGNRGQIKQPAKRGAVRKYLSTKDRNEHNF